MGLFDLSRRRRGGKSRTKDVRVINLNDLIHATSKNAIKANTMKNKRRKRTIKNKTGRSRSRSNSRSRSRSRY
jgi:hypothetical protein